MEKFILRIHPNKDFKEIKNEKKKDEAIDEFYNEVDFIFKILKNNEINFDKWEQIDDNSFEIKIDTYRDKFNDDIMLECLDNIRANLKIKDIAYPTVDNLIDYRHR